MNIVYGYGGLRTDRKPFKLNPSIPKTWKSYSFKFQIKETKITVEVTQNGFTLTLNQDLDMPLNINDEEIFLRKGENSFKFSNKR
jgi:maltose phosphorylase